AARSGAAIKAADPSTMTSVAIRPFRFTTLAPSGIFWPGSVMIVKRMPRAMACSIFFPTFSRISETVDVSAMTVSVDCAINSPVLSCPGPFEFLFEVDAAREELRQILRNRGATILNGGLYLFEWRRLAVRFRNATQAFIRREPSFAVMGSARPAGLAVVAFFLLFWSVFT